MSHAHSLRRAVAALCLVVAFLAQVLLVAARSSMTNDEGYHTFAGYRYWQCGDFGINPEHPPVAKMLAALPLRLLHTAPPQEPCGSGPTDKLDGYGASNRWYLGSTGSPARANPEQVLWRARCAISAFTVVLAVTAFLFTRRLYGGNAALFALALLAFEPTLIAHGALVTTDMAVSALSLLTVYCFLRLQERPLWTNAALAGVCCGLTLAVKHSGVLIVPVLLLLALFELLRGSREDTPDGVSAARRVLLLSGVLAVAYGVLWGSYGFRYAARPGGAVLSLPLPEFIAETTAQGNRSVLLHIIPALAHFHLLPEAYLYGFVDVLSISNPGQSAFLLGHLYPHGVSQYFPIVILIKTTLGMLLLGAVAVALVCARWLRVDRRALYLVTPAAVWLCAGIFSTLDIGYRHVLPIVAPACCLLGAACAAMWTRERLWRGVVVCLLAAHALASVLSFPNELAYANEAWGGWRNTYRLLTDSNNDWGQAIGRVPAWLDANGAGECWIAYDGILPPSHYGVRCHPLLPNGFGVTGPPVPETVSGTVLISGLSLSGIEWERPELNPYRQFLQLTPAGNIGGSILAYRGSFSLRDENASYQIVLSANLNSLSRFAEALAAADRALAVEPSSAFAHLQRAHALAGLGRTTEAHAEFAAAEAIAAPQPQWYFLQLPEIRDGLSATAAAGH